MNQNYWFHQEDATTHTARSQNLKVPDSDQNQPKNNNQKEIEGKSQEVLFTVIEDAVTAA